MRPVGELHEHGAIDHPQVKAAPGVVIHGKDKPQGMRGAMDVFLFFPLLGYPVVDRIPGVVSVREAVSQGKPFLQQQVIVRQVGQDRIPVVLDLGAFIIDSGGERQGEIQDAGGGEVDECLVARVVGQPQGQSQEPRPPLAFLSIGRVEGIGVWEAYVEVPGAFVGIPIVRIRVGAFAMFVDVPVGKAQDDSRIVEARRGSSSFMGWWFWEKNRSVRLCKAVVFGTRRATPVLVLPRVQTDFFMVKVVNQRRMPLFGATVRQVVYPIREAVLCGIGGHFVFEGLPVVGLAVVVDLFVQGIEFRVFFPDVRHDRSFELSAQVEIFHPDEVCEILYPFDDGFYFGNAREDGRNEANGADTRLVDLPHGLEPTFDAHCPVHVGAEGFVERVDGPGDRNPRKLLEQVHVAQNQIRFGADQDFGLAALQLFQQPASAQEVFLVGVVTVGYRADDHALPVVFVRIVDRFPMFDIEKRSPGLGMTGEAFHERSVAIFAGVGASYVGIDRVATHRQGRAGHHASYIDLANDFFLFHALFAYDRVC